MILLYVEKLIFILVWNFQKHIYKVDIFLTFAAIEKVVGDQRTKIYQKNGAKDFMI